MPIDHRVWRIAPVLFLFLLLSAFVLKSWLLNLLFLGFFIFHFAFFRDPQRSPAGEGLISPADGKVVDISTVHEDRYLQEEAVKVGIFLSVFNVHVNRAPAEGKVEYIQYIPGKFFNALREDSVKYNESNWIGIAGKTKILVRQISGTIARRICCDVKIGQMLQKGEKLGMICYGSRVECYFPKRLFRAAVKIGDIVKTGHTVLAVPGESIV